MVGFLTLCLVLSVAACSGSAEDQGSAVTVEAIAAATTASEYTMTTWLASEGDDPRSLPPIAITSVSGVLTRTENNGLAWIRASAAAEGASSEALAELDALIAGGPNVTIETPEGVYFTRPDLLEFGAGREPTFAPGQIGFVSRSQMDKSDCEVAQALQRLTTALGGSATTDPLQFLSEFGATIRDVASSGTDGLDTVEACAPAIDLMKWFVGAVGGSDAEVDAFVDEVGDRVRGKMCWTLEIDDQGRLRRSRADMDFKNLLRGELPSDMPDVLTEEIEWAYTPVGIQVPTVEPVDVSEAYFELLES